MQVAIPVRLAILDQDLQDYKIFRIKDRFVAERETHPVNPRIRKILIQTSEVVRKTLPPFVENTLS